MRANPFFKNRQDVAQLLLFVVFGFALPMALFVLGLSRFPPADGGDPVVLFVGGTAFVLAATVLSRAGKKVFGKEARGFLLVVLIGGTAFLATLAVLGLFLIGNAVFDTGKAREEDYVVVRRETPPTLLVESGSEANRTTQRIDAQKAYWQASPGSRLVLTVRPGFFGRPWVAGRTVEGVTNLDAEPQPQHQTKAFPLRYLGTTALVVLIIWFIRRAPKGRRPL